MSSRSTLRRMLGAMVLAVAVLVSTSVTAQQDYPSKPVRIIVPSVAGGGTDSSTRIVVSKLADFLGQRVVVDNRPGAGSMIGTEMVARAAPDGYTLLAAVSTITIQPSMQKNLPFDPVKDFAPVSVFVRLPNVLVGHPSLQPKNVKELIPFAKANPGKLEFASAGTGSSLHLCMEMFLSMAGLKMVHVPYKGASQAMADVAAGYVPFMVTNMISGIPQFKAGRLRAYGVTSAKRSGAAPEIPTIAEQGVPGYDVQHWFGILAPAKTDAKRIVWLHDELATVLRMREVAQAFNSAGADPVTDTPREFDAYLRSEIARWTKVVKAAGVKPE